jgi:hypothetical protein
MNRSRSPSLRRRRYNDADLVLLDGALTGQMDLVERAIHSGATMLTQALIFAAMQNRRNVIDFLENHINEDLIPSILDEAIRILTTTADLDPDVRYNFLHIIIDAIHRFEHMNLSLCRTIRQAQDQATPDLLYHTLRVLMSEGILSPEVIVIIGVMSENIELVRHFVNFIDDIASLHHVLDVIFSRNENISDPTIYRAIEDRIIFLQTRNLPLN